jgi:hypothetical protein
MVFLHSILGDDDVAGAESTTAPSWGTIAIYARWVEMRGSAGLGVPKYERGTFCVCKFFVSD